MKTYLVDFENVKSKGLFGIDRLTEDDHVIIFYSENSDTISFEMHCLVMKAKASVDYMKVRVGGKNALDFQLSTLLGYLVAKGDNTHLFIISNDKGFDKLHDFWENTFDDAPSCKVFRTVNINAAVNFAGSKKAVPDPDPSEEQPDAPEDTLPADVPEKTVEVEVVRPAEPQKPAEKASVPETVIYSMVGSSDLEEHIAPKPAKPAETKPARSAEKKKQNGSDRKDAPAKAVSAAAEVPAKQPEKTAKQQEPSKKTVQDKSAKKDRPAKQDKTAPVNDKGGKKKNDKTAAKTEDEEMILPKMILPGQVHPLIAADEEQVAAYSKQFAEFLATPEAQDKHRLLAGFMEGVPDKDIDIIRELIIQSDCKLELHNLLMKKFDNETSTRYYTMLKKYYFFLKQVMPDEPPAVIAAAAAQANKKPGKKRGRKSKEEKLAAGEPIIEATPPKPIKVTPAMKKKLHELLDDTASADEFSGVVSLMNESGTNQQLYINLMQRFSRARGRELYRIVKEAFAGFLTESAAKEAGEKKLSKNAHLIDAKPKRSYVKQSEIEITDGEARLHELTDGIIKPENYNDVYEAVLEANTVHRLYLGLIRRFGRTHGSQIYNAVKQELLVIKEALMKEENDG